MINVKVLDEEGFGTWSEVTAGVAYVLERQELDPGTPRVINLSLGGGYSADVEAIIKQAIDAGIFVVAASGNDTADACDHFPASMLEVMTVGATTYDDEMAPFSNWGSCVDI